MSQAYPHPLIAREGRTAITTSILLAVTLHILAGAGIAIPFWILALLTLQFFRDPPRPIPAKDNTLLSPADGKVTSIDTQIDPYRQQPALRISIKTGILNVHSNRSPIDGDIERIEYHPDTNEQTRQKTKDLQEEHNALLAKTKHGHALTIVQKASTLAGRIYCYPRAGDKLKRGQRYGFTSLGAKVDVYLPLDAKVCVSIGDKVSVTSTILAELR